ncbi:MAG: hypothetical protein JO022_21235, partial [Acidobacteriaceae bacterium]|nr:hypothetical protein [Acidobacteriaceae bacterium]
LGTWTSVTTGLSNINFNGLAPVNSFKDYSNSTGLVLNGVDFVGYYQSAPTYSLIVADAGYISPYYNFGTGGSLRGPVNDRASSTAFLPYIHVILPANVTAVATDLMTVSPNNVPFKVTLSDGESFTVQDNAVRPATTFFGVTADSPIAYIDFSLPSSSINAGTFAMLKDFSFGTASVGGASGGGNDPADTPEAATMILIGTGLVTFGYMQRNGFGLPRG